MASVETAVGLLAVGQKLDRHNDDKLCVAEVCSILASSTDMSPLVWHDRRWSGSVPMVQSYAYVSESLSGSDHLSTGLQNKAANHTPSLFRVPPSTQVSFRFQERA